MAASAPLPPRALRGLYWLQGLTLLWMGAEFSLSAYAAWRAHSPLLAVFGSDSLVELLSAALVLAQWIPALRLGERRAARLAALLLLVLSAFCLASALLSLYFQHEPQSSWMGVAVTLAALVAMPALAWLKRREARRLGNVALRADAAQSAACAYLALATLAGLAARALLGWGWLDPAAALCLTPFLLREARAAWKGQPCCCGGCH